MGAVPPTENILRARKLEESKATEKEGFVKPVDIVLKKRKQKKIHVVGKNHNSTQGDFWRFSKFLN